MKEWGTICNLFLYIISWDQWVAGVLCPAGVHPSVSVTSKSVICFPFLCPIPFFFKNSWSFLSLFFHFLFYSLLCFLLKKFCLSALPFMTCYTFFHPINHLHVREPIVEAACADKTMVPVASDAHAFLSIKFGMCSNHQISWLTWIHPIITYTSCI